MTTTRQVLFVCSGNTCRSPLAESILRTLLTTSGRADVEVGSAGTAAVVGAPASDGAYLVGLEAGFDLGGHRARRISPDLVHAADLVLTMTAEQARQVSQLAGETAHVFQLASFAGGAAHLSDVSDPFGGPLEGYRDTLRELEKLVRVALNRFPAPSE